MKKGLLALEVFSVLCGLLYTFLIIYGSIWCWMFGLLSGVGFLALCAVKKLYAESALQIFYIATAVIGYLNWGETNGTVQKSLPLLYHTGIITAAAALTLTTGYLLKNLTTAATPLVDSFTTVFSIFATLLMIYLIPENWLYWIVIDAVSIYLYAKRKLYVTTGLFVLYTAMAIYGTVQWLA